MAETVPGGGQYRGIIFDMGGAGIPVRKTVTFTGATSLGAIGDVPLFTVTGTILVVSLIPICTTDLVENSAATLMSLGVTDIVALFIAATEPEDIDEDDVWDAVAPATTAVALPALLKDIIVVGAANDILATVAGDTVTGGVLQFNLRYIAISDGATVVAA
ncbi:hypothetical protein LCGC14_1727210 [marine sediment metagenome]|uniref:Uncharacterized protein n=1 Tax=marine sediment metagenome TaxID=412755 RepID=A0A0F9KAC4_9ZZZZ